MIALSACVYYRLRAEVCMHVHMQAQTNERDKEGKFQHKPLWQNA